MAHGASAQPSAATRRPGEGHDTGSVPGQGWTFSTFRVMVGLQVLAIFVQAITAGLVVAGRPGAKPLHGTTATVALLVGLLTLVAAILVWKPGGGSARFTVPSAVLLVLLVVQSILGGNHVKAVHVPLGVALFGGVVVVALQAWSGPRARSVRS
ncbi:hypothetical protein [Actinopolymorpha pittospori]